MLITKVIRYTALSAGLLLTLTGCDDLMKPAKENLKSIEETQEESSSVKGFLVNAYRALPAYYDNSDYATDDAVTNQKDNAFLKLATGSWTAENNPTACWNASYAAIQYIHLFLSTMEGQQYVKNETVNQLLTQRLTGEAHALRAIHMYYLLRAHAGRAGGQLLGVQTPDGFVDTNSDFNQPRAPFADCVRRALADLDKAAELLPMDYNDVTTADEIPAKFRSITTQPELYNRAMGNKARQLANGLIVDAFRSRRLLLAASPAFQEGADWAAAADAAARVVDYAGGVSGLVANGLTYYANTADIDAIREGSNPKEIIWRENVASDNRDQEQANFPPSLFGNGQMNPTQNLVDAFPMANGYPISDSRSGYDAQNPYAGRDPRLDLYIIHDGSTAGVDNATIRTGSRAGNDGIDAVESRSTRTGYYMKKRLRMDVNCNPASAQGKPHYTPRLRFTEFFLNYAEAANEAWGPKGTGSHGYSAYDVVKAIRQRAGIEADDPYLEECAADKDKMRSLIRNERRLELCFESFRFWDLRRWKAELNETARGLDVNEDVNGITITPLNSVEGRSFQSYMIYGPIPYSETLKYSQLQQNEGW